MFSNFSVGCLRHANSAWIFSLGDIDCLIRHQQYIGLISFIYIYILQFTTIDNCCGDFFFWIGVIDLDPYFVTIFKFPPSGS